MTPQRPRTSILRCCRSFLQPQLVFPPTTAFISFNARSLKCRTATTLITTEQPFVLWRRHFSPLTSLLVLMFGGDPFHPSSSIIAWSRIEGDVGGHKVRSHSNDIIYSTNYSFT